MTDIKNLGTTEEGSEKYIDLHLHLDGAITVDIARKLAGMQDMELPASDEELKKQLTVPEDCTSLDDFLRCFELPLTLLQTKEGLDEAVFLVSEMIKEKGVIYAEIRFAPQLHTDRDMTQEDAVLAALDGVKRSGIHINLILCCMRGEGNDAQNEETLRLAKKYLVEDGGVVAIDLAGAEGLFPTAKYESLFAEAVKANIPFTIHAGEAAGADSVRAAIEYGAARIGHGVRMNEDDEVVKLVRERHIPLEMCPTSNRQTHAVEDMSSYPLADYLRSGICVTINTDDPAIEGTDIAAEFAYIEKEFSISPDEKKQILKNSVMAAFTTDEVKQGLLSLIV
ncbi:MAG: adenosine deaminase [Eubacterium sp.]|nr:adenosine deaminase [Eubacterium sp.]